MRCLSAFLLLTALTASGQTTLDQSFLPDRSATTGAGLSPIGHAQTFTVGLQGTLTSLDVYLRGSASAFGPLSWQLRSTVGGAPVENPATILASGEVSAASIPIPNFPPFEFFSLQLTNGGVSVRPGDTLAIVLSPATAYYWAGEWGGGSRDPYSRGSHFVLLPDGTWAKNEGVDMGFKTFVKVSPRLYISRSTPEELELSWTTNAPTFRLESTDNLTNGWIAVTNEPTIIAERFRVTVPNANSVRLFRLTER